MDGIIKKVEEFAKPYCKADPEDPNLWENHTRLVRKYAVILAEIEGADKQVVEIAAILHDIGKDKGRKKHNLRSYELSKKFLQKIDLPEEKKKLILKCVLKHSTRYSHEDNELEVKIVQSADALGTLFEDEWQRYTRETMPKEEILILYEKSLSKINLESARKIATPRIEELKKLLD